MKKNYLITLFIILLLFIKSFLIFPQKVQTRAIEPFDKISVSGGIEITIEKGDTESIKLDSDDQDLSNVVIKIKDKTLKIRFTEDIFNGHRQVKAHLIFRELQSMTLSDGSEINNSSPINSDKLEIKAGSGSEVILKVQLKTLHANVNEGATVTLEGKCQSPKIDVTSGGIFNAYDLKCDNSIIKASTGGIAKIFVVNKLEATASTGGQISYRGNPAIKKEHTILGGSIEKTVE